MEPLIAAAVGLILGALAATGLAMHGRRARRETDEFDVHVRVRGLASQLRGEAPRTTEEALDMLAIGIAELKSDTARLLDTIATQTLRIARLEQGDSRRRHVLAATRAALQTHLSRVSQERDGLMAQMDHLGQFASGGLEYSEPLPSLVGADLEDLPTDPPDLPFDLRGGGPSRGRA